MKGMGMKWNIWNRMIFFYLSTNNLVTIIPAITQKISPTPLMIHSLYCKKKLQKKTCYFNISRALLVKTLLMSKYVRTLIKATLCEIRFMQIIETLIFKMQEKIRTLQPGIFYSLIVCTFWVFKSQIFHLKFFEYKLKIKIRH